MSTIRVVGDAPVFVTVERDTYELKTVVATDIAGGYVHIAAINLSTPPTSVGLSSYFKDKLTADRAFRLGFECKAQFGTAKAIILAELKKHPMVESKVKCRRCSALHFRGVFGHYCSELCERKSEDAKTIKHVRSFAQDEVRARESEKFRINSSSGQRRLFYTEPGRD